MDNQHQPKTRDTASSKQEEEKLKTTREGHSTDNKPQQQQLYPPPPPQNTTSPSSSPSHDFSFTISLLPDHKNRAAPPPPSAAVLDLSPADDIFFHGHLLPLHLLSHLPVSPRSSINSLDSFTLPAIKDSLRDPQNPNNRNGISECISSKNSSSSSSDNNIIEDNIGTKERFKSKSLSLFGLSRWRKGYEIEIGSGEEKEKQSRKRRKSRFDVSRVLKRYMTMVRPLLLFRPRRKEDINVQQQIRRQAFSFSGNLSPRTTRMRQGMMTSMHERRGEFSAPASMRASPANTGFLFATAMATAAAAAPPSSAASDSTMEELQAAIQAAIAYCKNSIAVEDKLNC